MKIYLRVYLILLIACLLLVGPSFSLTQPAIDGNSEIATVSSVCGKNQLINIRFPNRIDFSKYLDVGSYA
jgi:hypothetical protein